MTIANKASVDFKEFFGTVTSVADQEFDITCEAEKSRPPGKFSWRIELASSEIINLVNDLSPKEKPGANGFYRTEEVRKYLQNILPQGCFHLLFERLGHGICGFFFLWLSFSRSQVIIKKSSNDTFFHSK